MRAALTHAVVKVGHKREVVLLALLHVLQPCQLLLLVEVPNVLRAVSTATPGTHTTRALASMAPTSTL